MNTKKAIEHLNDARRLVNLCAAAAESDIGNMGTEIRLTLGNDVDYQLSLAIDELSAEEGAS